jgi:hypothetical protein
MEDWTDEAPWLTTEISGWKVQALKGVGPLQGIVDVQVESPDGRRFAAEFGTLKSVAEVMQNHQKSGESLGGVYFFTQNLIVLGEMNPLLLRRVLAHMIESSEIESAFELLEEDWLL